jgi:uncharacterized heparinase superfamily protein
VRRRYQQLRRLLELVGPRPLVLAQTIVFLASRRRRRTRLRSLYERPLPPGHVTLRLPEIDLPRFPDLPPELQEGAQRLRDDAEHVLAHRVDFLGSGLVELGPAIDWHRDFKSGYRWPMCFYQDVEITRVDDGSDAKVPWELSRGHQLLTLARAARVFEEEQFATELERQVASWLEANPPGIGINWTTSMEVGIRAVNIVWAVATLEGWRPLESGLRARVVESLRWHGRHLEANLEGTPYLRSNHYLGDLLGLIAVGSVLDGDPDAPRWAAFARRELEREIGRQVYDDGVSFEASLAYHGLVLEMLLICSYVARWAGRPFSERFDERVARMIEVSRAVRHPCGRVPLFGDQDSGRVLPEGFARPPTHDNVIWLAVAAAQSARPLAGPVHPEVAWVFGIDAWRRAAELPPAKEPARAFPDGGIYVLRSARLHAVMRCGEVGQNGAGGHSHNDLLSYELSVDGTPVVVDSGTYAYTFDVPARNAFRATAAHNTVTVDGLEAQPVDAERVFELRQFATPEVESQRLEGDELGLVASHDGYRRLSDGVIHRRRVSLVRDELTIVDELVGGDEHVLRSFVHLVPEASVVRSGATAFEIAVGDVGATFSFGEIAAEEVAVEESWISDRYGVRERAPVLVVTAVRRCPATLSYRIAPERETAIPRE